MRASFYQRGLLLSATFLAETVRRGQHGAGKKHERAIRSEAWQLAHVRAAPWAFLRGCIRSDGCVFENRTGRYAYLSYGFKNLSPEILELFASTCTAVGLHPRRTPTAVRLNRREDVARLLAHGVTKG